MLTPIRISNAAASGFAYTEVQYPSKSPFNCDCTRLLLLEPQNFSLWQFNGSNYLRIAPLPFLGDASEPLWSSTDPYTFYYHAIGETLLLAYNILTKTSHTLHNFIEYTQISGKGESALSEDGNHIVLIGDNRYVFVYNIATGQKSAVLDTDPHGLDSLYITPDNNVLISWGGTGTARFEGMELFDSNMNFLRQIATVNGHKGVTRDADGSEVLIWTNSAENPVTLPAFPNGIGLVVSGAYLVYSQGSIRYSRDVRPHESCLDQTIR